MSNYTEQEKRILKKLCGETVVLKLHGLTIKGHLIKTKLGEYFILNNIVTLPGADVYGTSYKKAFSLDCERRFGAILGVDGYNIRKI